MPRKRVTVCGIPILAVPHTYGGGNVYPGARDIGTYAEVSEKTARKLARSVDARLPQPGYELNLCKDTWLVNKAGRFEVDRRMHGGLKGRR